MTCKVSSKNIKTPRYSVLITAEKPLTDQSNPNGTTRIISLNQDSVVRLEDWTDQTRVDGVVLEKVQENEFRYRMYQTQISDAGLYRCVVTAWSPGGGGMWREAVNGLSNPIQIDFQTSGWCSICVWVCVWARRGGSSVTLFQWFPRLWAIPAILEIERLSRWCDGWELSLSPLVVLASFVLQIVYRKTFDNPKVTIITNFSFTNSAFMVLQAQSWFSVWNNCCHICQLHC